MEVERIYKYENTDGKTVIIKRKWRNKDTTVNKRQALNDYLEQNKDEIPKMKNYRAVFNDYNAKNPDYKVSYTTMIKNLHKLYGMKNKKHSSSSERYI